MTTRMILGLSVAWLAAAISPAIGAEQAPVPLPRAHAHNDYCHERPLLDALDQGFCSVEADIFLVDGQLLVAHNRSDVKPERTLESLYLASLAARVHANGGRVYRDGPVVTLLIDFKNDGAAMWQVLHKTLQRHKEILTRVEDGRVVEGAVTVVISGDRPFKEIEATLPRYAGIDGRMTDLDSDAPADLMPLISDNWSHHFEWRGKGSMPEEERQKLRDIVEKVHRSGRRLRFWATPDVEPMWRELYAAGVDLINTDNLAGLAEFLRKQD